MKLDRAQLYGDTVPGMHHMSTSDKGGLGDKLQGETPLKRDPAPLSVLSK